MDVILIIVGFIVASWIVGMSLLFFGKLLMKAFAEAIAASHRKSDSSFGKLLERCTMLEEAEQYERSRKEALKNENDELRARIAELEEKHE